MTLALILVFTLAYCLFAWTNFRLALYFFCLLLPTYLIRFAIGPLPSTLLEASFGALALVWLVRYAKNDLSKIKQTLANNKLLVWSLGVFFVASLAGIFVSDMWFYSLGQWRAYFFEPMLLFCICVGRREMLSGYKLVSALVLGGVSVSLLALLQKITGSFFPPSLWDDELFGRVTSFYTSPNAIGLYLAPLIPFAVSGALDAWKKNKKRISIFLTIVVLLSLGAILASRSLGAILALILGAIVYLWTLGWRRMVAGGLITVALLACIPSMQTFIASKNTSSNNRLTLWGYSKDFLTASPKNFIFGAGIRQFFRKVQKEHYNQEELERLIYPHNIILNFWTEIGLFGMLGFIGILIALFRLAFQISQKDLLFGAGAVAALTIFVAHGLIDVPYFKNDLAFIFWMLATSIWLVSSSKKIA